MHLHTASGRGGEACVRRAPGVELKEWKRALKQKSKKYLEKLNAAMTEAQNEFTTHTAELIRTPEGPYRARCR